MLQTWMVTGSSRGLGRQICLAALRAGHAVAATARTADHVADLRDSFGDRVLPLSLDVTDPAAVHEALQGVQDRFGGVDVVVNNAGQADFGAVEDVLLDSLTAQVDSNFWGVVHVTRAALPLLRTQGSGLLIQISSLAPGWAPPVSPSTRRRRRP